jgi:hypothetical protein
MSVTRLGRLIVGAVLAAAFTAAAQPSGPVAIRSAPERSGTVSPRAQSFVRLVAERAQAIDLAFGQIFPPEVSELRIVFVKSGKWAEEHPPGVSVYEPEARTLYFATRLQFQDAPMMSVAQYWPWYDETARNLFPVIEIIDAAIWTAVLTESARAHDLPWPHPQCHAFDVAERLPCEMLLYGAIAYTRQLEPPMFNDNRIAEIWPEDIAEFRARTWRRDERAYLDARKYGGFLLLRPLVREFGVARTLRYVAGVPFRVEQNNVRLSAELYQRRAQQALSW